VDELKLQVIDAGAWDETLALVGQNTVNPVDGFVVVEMLMVPE
jgi:hypothetical protein